MPFGFPSYGLVTGKGSFLLWGNAMQYHSTLQSRMLCLTMSVGALAIGICGYINLIPIDSLLHAIQTCWWADLCWAFAFPIAVQSVLLLRGKHIWGLFSCVTLGAVYELLQWRHIVPGTCDPLDLLTYLAGTAMAVFVLKYLWRRKSRYCMS